MYNKQANMERWNNTFKYLINLTKGKIEVFSLLNGSIIPETVGCRSLFWDKKKRRGKKWKIKSWALAINTVNLCVASVTIVLKSTKLLKKNYPR